MNTTTNRPAGVTDAHLTYLDQLRESGETNMFGAGPGVERIFTVSKRTATTIVVYWMNSFGKDDR